MANLHRASGLDEFEFDAVPLGPVGDGDACELSSVRAMQAAAFVIKRDKSKPS